MNIEEISSNIQTLYQKVFYLQAEITALRGASIELIKNHTKEEPGVIDERLSRLSRIEYDRLISEIENEKPAAAAYLDLRESLNKEDQDKWLFPRETGETEKD